MHIRKIEVQDQGVILEATVAFLEGAQKKPVIFVFHAWEGKGVFAEQKAIELAKLGYVGCALDLYGKGKFGVSREECSALMHPLFSDRAKLRQRILTYRDVLEKIPEADLSKIGAIGFCFGGLCALDLARSGADIKGVVSFHGLLGAPETLQNKKISSKVLVLHGGKDPMVSKKELFNFIEEMELKEVDFQVHIFGRAMHAFSNPEANDSSFGTLYDKDADKRSFELMKLFFLEVF